MRDSSSVVATVVLELAVAIATSVPLIIQGRQKGGEREKKLVSIEREAISPTHAPRSIHI